MFDIHKKYEDPEKPGEAAEGQGLKYWAALSFKGVLGLIFIGIAIAMWV